jgi:hypothetical protein
MSHWGMIVAPSLKLRDKVRVSPTTIQTLMGWFDGRQDAALTAR